MEKLEINILTQNFEIKKIQKKKTLKIKIINIKVRKENVKIETRKGKVYVKRVAH